MELLLERNFLEDSLILVSEIPKMEYFLIWMNLSRHLNLVLSLSPLVLRDAMCSWLSGWGSCC